MKQYTLLTEARIDERQTLHWEPGNIPTEAPWALGMLFFAVNLKAHGTPGPYTIEQFSTLVHMAWEDDDYALMEQAFDYFVEAGIMEVSFLN